VQRAAFLVEAQRNSDLYLPPLIETLDEIQAVLAGPGPVLVARLGHRLVGSVRARIDGDTAHMSRLSVAPDLQGHGVGNLLVAAMEEACAGLAGRFTFFTGAESTGNLHLFRKYGYQIVEHQLDPNGNRVAVLAKSVGAGHAP
jgi:ribosomal protein S18 acetylase RimI-like enzyme